MLPKLLGNKQCCRGEALAHRLGRVLPRGEPPGVGRCLAIRWVAGDAQPAQDIVPYLPREWAGEEEMPEGVRRLVTEWAARGVLQAATGEAVSGPTPV